MRIKKARIQNFKSIIDSGVINLDEEITAFIGKNEQGKTNFLKSLTTINKNYSYKEDDLHYGSSQNQENPIVTLWFTLNEQDEEFFKASNLDLLGHDTLRISKFFHNTYDINLAQSPVEIQITDETWFKDSKKELYTEIEKFLKRNIKIIERKNEESHIEYILSLETNEGGFRNDIVHPSTLSATYHAIETLKELNSLDKVNKNKIIEFILSNDGKEYGLPDLPRSLEFTFYALISLENLYSINKLDKNKYIKYVLSLQNEDGGFAQTKQQLVTTDSSMENTFFAIKY